MNYHTIQNLYDDLVSNPDEEWNHMWLNLLSLYFPTRDDYGLGIRLPERRPDGVASDPRFTVQEMQVLDSGAGKIKPFLVVVESRARRVEPEAWESSWQYAIQRVNDELLDMRSATPSAETRMQPRADDALYGIAAIGRHLRFLELRPGEDKVQDMGGGAERQVYELKEDEETVHSFFAQIYEKTAAGEESMEDGAR